MPGVLADKKGLKLLHEVAADIPEIVCGDPTRLREILINLVDNAIKFTDTGEVAIKVRTAPEQGLLHFTVSDTGIGIPEDKRESIFAPFTQVDNSSTRRFGGTGLGLTISTRLVEMMGGKLWAESQPGKGSTFTIRLPRIVEACAKAGLDKVAGDLR